MTNYTNYSSVAVDGIISSSSQGLMMGTVTTMPTATAARDGCVVYYIGADTATYTQDTWYRCKESETPGTYEWEELDIGGSGATYRNMMAQVTLSASGWSENTQTATVNGLRATDIVVSSPIPSQVDTYQYCGIVQTANAANSITFTCDTVPSVDITVNVAMIATTPSVEPELVVDPVPTQGSTNPVQSGGTYTALAAKQDSLTFDTAPTDNSTNPVTSGGVYTALSGKQPTLSTAQQAAVDSGINSTKVSTYDGYATAISGKMDSTDFHTIGGTYGSDNPVTTQEFVNSSISTNTATFKGTFNVVADLGLTTAATASDVATALNAHTFSTAPTNNDYCFVYFDLSTDPGNIDRYERYKFTAGSPGTWGYEYTLNNSSFTADQWAAINSGVTSGVVTAVGGKQDTLVVGTNMDSTPTQNSTYPVTSGGVYSAINSVLPTVASGDAGKVLTVNSGETGVNWSTNILVNDTPASVHNAINQEWAENVAYQDDTVNNIVHKESAETVMGEKTFVNEMFLTADKIASIYAFKTTNPNINILRMIANNSTADVSAQLMLRVGDDGSITLMIQKRKASDGSYISQTTVATL